MYTGRWAEGCVLRTVKNHMSALRWWAEHVGRRGVVGTNAAHGIGERCYVTKPGRDIARSGGGGALATAVLKGAAPLRPPSSVLDGRVVEIVGTDLKHPLSERIGKGGLDFAIVNVAADHMVGVENQDVVGRTARAIADEDEAEIDELADPRHPGVLGTLTAEARVEGHFVRFGRDDERVVVVSAAPQVEIGWRRLAKRACPCPPAHP